MKNSRAVVWFILLMGMSGAAQAKAIVEWDLRNVLFDDGGTATGSFTYLRGGVYDMDMKSSGGDLPPTRYAPGTADGFQRFWDIFFCNPDEPERRKQCLIFLVVNVPEYWLPDSGGVVPLSKCPEPWESPRPPFTGLCVSLHEERNTFFTRRAISGELIGTVVPEPATLWHLCLGLLIGLRVGWRSLSVASAAVHL